MGKKNQKSDDKAAKLGKRASGSKYSLSLMKRYSRYSRLLDGVTCVSLFASLYTVDNLRMITFNRINGRVDLLHVMYTCIVVVAVVVFCKRTYKHQ